jgi:RNA polymerase sigma factor (sigma-70 family)
VEQEDVELLRAYQRDADETAFARLVERHSGWIFAAARRRLGDDHLAEDATQAVFVVLAGKASQLVESRHGSLSAWLFHVMHFACIRVRRSRLRQVEREGLAEPSAAQNDGDDIASDGALLILMEDSIAQLPVIEREMIVRRFYQRESFVQIGDALKITADAARKRVGRALLKVRSLMVRDGVDAIPDTFLAGLKQTASADPGVGKAAVNHKRIDSIAKGTVDMVEQAKACEYPVVSAEFFVSDVDANLEFFEKLGFRRRYVEVVDAMGRVPRASLVAGVGRIWLRRAAESDGTRPMPGVTLYFWVDGGADALLAHRKRIADEGVVVSPFTDDISLRNFTVTTPDGYSIGFFTQYR